jgi:hypothetical protein
MVVNDVPPWGGLGWGEGGLLAAPVGLALDDEFPRGGLEPVDRGLGEQWVGERGEPLVGVAVGGDQRGRLEPESVVLFLLRG